VRGQSGAAAFVMRFTCSITMRGSPRTMAWISKRTAAQQPFSMALVQTSRPVQGLDVWTNVPAPHRKAGSTWSPSRRTDSSVFWCGVSKPSTGTSTTWSKPTASKRRSVAITSAGVPTQMPFWRR